MKQAIAAFLLCLSLVLGGVALAAHTLQEDAGQVAVTAISRQGDPAAAQGLVATQSCQYAQTLLWDLTIPLDRPAQSTTAFSAQRDVPAAANDDAGVYHRFPHQDATLSAEPGYFLDNLPTSPALGPLYEQVARRTPPGQTRTEILNPSQFLDAYPLQVTLDLAGQSPDYSQAETFESQFDPSAQEAFQAFFRFPFAPDTRWKVTVTKDQDGLLTQLAIAPTGEEFLTGTVSTVGAHTAYFTLTPSTQTGSTLPDFQQVPGGYGLYRLRFLTGEGGRVQIDPDSLEMVYPLDPRAVSVLSLTLSPQEDTLFLVTIQEGQTRCLVLDTETMDLRTAFSIPAGKPTQHLEASVSAEDEVLSRTQYDVTQVLPGENCLLALGQETFHFFSQTPEGHYQYRWSGRLPDGLLSFPVCNARAAWNGEKLALGIYDGETLTTGLSLWIYDREGTILYQGDYATSLEQVYGWHAADADTLTTGSPVQVVERKDRALTLSWKS